MISEVDVAKKCYQILHKVPKKCYQMWQNVAKVAKKCYQMWQKVAKRVLTSSKGFQGGFQGKVLPDVAKSRQRGSKAITGGSNWFQRGFQGGTVPRGVPRWVPRESATRCGKMSPKGFQGVSKDSKGFQGKVVPDVAKKRQRGSKGKCYQMWQKVAKGVTRPRRRRLAQGPSGQHRRQAFEPLCLRK